MAKLSEIVYQKVASLFSKCVKQKKQNKSFQDAMLKELDHLNKALIEKKKKGRDKDRSGQQQEGPSRSARRKPPKQKH